MSWTQPICHGCFQKRFGREPNYKLDHPRKEICCDCGAKTRDGIYARVDPKSCKFPAKDK